MWKSWWDYQGTNLSQSPKQTVFMLNNWESVSQNTNSINWKCRKISETIRNKWIIQENSYQTDTIKAKWGYDGISCSFKWYQARICFKGVIETLEFTLKFIMFAWKLFIISFLAIDGIFSEFNLLEKLFTSMNIYYRFHES